MLDVKDQKDVNSCVACVLSTIAEYFCRLQGDETEAMSIGYIYGNRTNTDHKDPGMVIRKTLAVMCEYGDVIHSLFPYNEEVPHIIEKFEKNLVSLFAKGYPHRFSSYYKCWNEREIKAALTKKSPVAMSIKWYRDIEVVDGVIQTACDPATSIFNHAMVIYGWNETGWKIQNSWGTEWGVGGRAILPYSVPLNEAWGVVDDISENQTRLRIAELEKERQVLIEAKEEIERKTAEIEQLKSELTELKKPYSSPLGQLFARLLNLIFYIFDKNNN